MSGKPFLISYLFSSSEDLLNPTLMPAMKVLFLHASLSKSPISKSDQPQKINQTLIKSLYFPLHWSHLLQALIKVSVVFGSRLLFRLMVYNQI